MYFSFLDSGEKKQETRPGSSCGSGNVTNKLTSILIMYREGFVLKAILIIVFLFLLPLNVVSASDEENAWARKLIQEGKKSDAYRPENGYVPDSVTAIRIAVNVWLPIYGKEHFQNRKQYNAILVDGYWVVSGALESYMKGGVAYAVIEKKSGEIVYVIHAK